MGRYARWLVRGCLVVAAVMVGAWEAEGRPRTRMICEEWRDYVYNAETGHFIEWAGTPYWVCRFEDDPVSYPDSPDPDRYGGGIGHPQDPRHARCERCRRSHMVCMDGIRRGIGRCIRHYQGFYRGWCVRYKRQRFGAPVDGPYACESGHDPGGKPGLVCTGPGIDACVDSFSRDFPSTSIQNRLSMDLKLDSFGIGQAGTVSVSWGGATGFMNACRSAGDHAGLTCLNDLSACEEDAGGCNR